MSKGITAPFAAPVGVAEGEQVLGAETTGTDPFPGKTIGKTNTEPIGDYVNEGFLKLCALANKTPGESKRVGVVEVSLLF